MLRTRREKDIKFNLYLFSSHLLKNPKRSCTQNVVNFSKKKISFKRKSDLILNINVDRLFDKYYKFKKLGPFQKIIFNFFC